MALASQHRPRHDGALFTRQEQVLLAEWQGELSWRWRDLIP